MQLTGGARISVRRPQLIRSVGRTWDAKMKSAEITFAGPDLDDRELLERLPEPLVALLGEVNGFILFSGGLHVRGACKEPAWHSLRAAWEGPLSFQQLYRGIAPSDIPFGEDCMGDQFLLRADKIVRLAAETGDLKETDVSLVTFLDQVRSDPIESLQMHPLVQFEGEGNVLHAGELLAAYPPFFAAESREGVSLRAMPALAQRAFLADVAAQVRDLPDGATVTFRVVQGSKGRPTTR
jgi:hypothetical protein